MAETGAGAAPGCHLWPVLAARAPVAVIVRRGPAKLVQIILWHTDTDVFEPGQWLKGNISGPRAGLSPDGQLFVYGARKCGGRRRRWQEVQAGGIGELWTAVSRPPYLTALALWGHLGCDHGGGEYIDQHTLALRESAGASRPFLGPLPRYMRLRFAATDYFASSSGWRTESQQDWPFRWRRPGKKVATLYRDAPLPRNARTACDFALGDDSGLLPLGRADWAGWLQDGRLAMTRGGKLLVCERPASSGCEWRELADFQGNRFSPVATPGWAKRWPG